MKENLKKYLVEFIGTFFLVFTIGTTVLAQSQDVIPAIAIGFILAVMVYAGGHISGGHYNPAVSLAATVRGALSYKQLIPYWLFQIAGGALAILAVSYVSVLPPEGVAMAYDVKALIIGEFLFTFALCYVVLLTATTRAVEGNSYFGLAIGSTVMAGIFAVGGQICLAAFNPAVAISLGMINITTWNFVALTVLTNLIAAIVAAYTYKAVSCDRC